MRETIIALGILGVDEVIVGDEHGVGYFGTDLAGVVRGIEAGYFGDGGFAVDAGLEEVLVADSAAGDYAEAGYYDAFFIGFGGCCGSLEFGGGGATASLCRCECRDLCGG